MRRVTSKLEKERRMTRYRELYLHWRGVPDSLVAEIVGTDVVQVEDGRGQDLQSLTSTALENVLEAVRAGNVPASIWLLDSKLVQTWHETEAAARREEANNPFE